MNPFGWRASEWGWQCVLALLLWQLSPLQFCFGYVDNFFVFSANNAKAPSHSEKVSRLLSTLRPVGTPLHEIQDSGHSMNALGWDWDSSGPVSFMICTNDKFDMFCKYLVLWSSKSSLSFTDVMRAVGLMLFLAAGFPAGKAHIAAFSSMRAKGQAIADSHPALAHSSISIKIDAQAGDALSFWT